MSTARQWVLWGFHPSYGRQSIKITAGPLSVCQAERRTRTAQGWTDLRILPGK